MNETVYTYVDIATILDLNLAACAMVNPAKAAELCISGKYHTRIHNRMWEDLDWISEEAFHIADQDRSELKMSFSKMTKFLIRLRELCRDTNVMNVSSPFMAVNTIHIDFMGYDISDEAKKAIIDHLKFVLCLTNIIEVNIGLGGLTPSVISNRYNSVCLYNFDQWINMHAKALAAAPVMSTNFVVPMVFHGDTKTDTDMITPYREGLLADRLAAELCGVLKLEGQPLDLFSIINI